MSIDSIQNRSAWDNTLYTASATSLGSQSSQNDFEASLTGASIGFGARDESGALTSSIATVQNSTEDLISQLQYSMLVNDGSNGMSSRLNNILL